MGAKKKLKKLFKKTIAGNLLGMNKQKQAQTPDVVTRDPEAEKRAADDKAQATANEEAALKKKQRKANSLLSAGGEAGVNSSVLGKTKLGE